MRDKVRSKVAIKQQNGSFEVYDVIQIRIVLEDQTQGIPENLEIIYKHDLGVEIVFVDEVEVLLLPCTGLKDCEGTLIYHGDILEKPHGQKWEAIVEDRYIIQKDLFDDNECICYSNQASVIVGNKYNKKAIAS